jgi:pimeloyl-ACP methyl ester carboxylesterase
MTAHPAQLLILLSLGLATLAILLAAAFVLYQLRRKQTVHVVRPSNGTNNSFATVSTSRWTPKERWILATLAALMLLWGFAGKYLVQPFFSNTGNTSEKSNPVYGQVKGSSGANLTVARYGPGAGPTLLFTHGWGADHQDWSYVIGSLKNQFSVVAWDLPGLGQSSPASDYAMKTLAGDLNSVVSSIQGPVIIVGHSIGGILNIEYARQFPEKMGQQVKGFIQVNTTYTNPIETKKGADTSRKLQKPVYEPLLQVVTWSSPIARGLGWLAYRSGLAHLQLAKQSFAGNETWEQLDHMASYAYRSSPGVIAQGVLGMLQWDGSDVLKKISVPTLIVSGNEDVTTLPLASDKMERDIPMAKRISVSGAAHLGPVERHELYADAIRSFAMQSQ